MILMHSCNLNSPWGELEVVQLWQKQRPQSDTKQFLRIRVNTFVKRFAEFGARRQFSSHLIWCLLAEWPLLRILIWIGMPVWAFLNLQAHHLCKKRKALFCCWLGEGPSRGCVGAQPRRWSPEVTKKPAPAPGFLTVMLIFLLIYSLRRRVGKWSIIMCWCLFGSGFRSRTRHLRLRIETSGPRKLSHLRHLTNRLD